MNLTRISEILSDIQSHKADFLQRLEALDELRQRLGKHSVDALENCVDLSELIRLHSHLSQHIEEAVSLDDDLINTDASADLFSTIDTLELALKERLESHPRQTLIMILSQLKNGSFSWQKNHPSYLKRKAEKLRCSSIDELEFCLESENIPSIPSSPEPSWFGWWYQLSEEEQYALTSDSGMDGRIDEFCNFLTDRRIEWTPTIEGSDDSSESLTSHVEADAPSSPSEISENESNDTSDLNPEVISTDLDTNKSPAAEDSASDLAPPSVTSIEKSDDDKSESPKSFSGTVRKSSSKHRVSKERSEVRLNRSLRRRAGRQKSTKESIVNPSASVFLPSAVTEIAANASALLESPTPQIKEEEKDAPVKKKASEGTLQPTLEETADSIAETSEGQLDVKSDASNCEESVAEESVAEESVAEESQPSPTYPPLWPNWTVFKESVWLRANGDIEAAPWTQEGFYQRVQTLQLNALLDKDWAVALLCSQLAGQSLEPLFLEQDILSVHALSAGIAVFQDTENVSMEEGNPLDGGDVSKLRLILAMLKGEHLQDGEDIMELYDFSKPFRSFLSLWNRNIGIDDQMFEQIHAGLNRPDEDRNEQVLDRLSLEKEKLIDLIENRNGEMYRKGGFNLARLAWGEFCEGHFEALRVLCGTGTLSSQELNTIQRMKRQAKKIFDVNEVMYTRRRHFDNRVHEIYTVAQTILQLQDRRPVNSEQVVPKNIKAICQYLHDLDLNASVWYEQLIHSQLHQLFFDDVPRQDPSILSIHQISYAPHMVWAWEAQGVDQFGADIAQCEDPRYVVAALLHPFDTDVSQVSVWLERERAELLSRLNLENNNNTEVKSNSYLKNCSQQSEDELTYKMQEVLGRLSDLQPLVLETGSTLFSNALDASFSLVENIEKKYIRIYTNWLNQIHTVLEAYLQAWTTDMLSKAKSSNPYAFARCQELIQKRRYASIYHLLDVKTPEEIRIERVTEFRSSAEKAFRSPSKTLKSWQEGKSSDLRPLTEIESGLVQDWLAYHNTEHVDSEMSGQILEKFVKYIFERPGRKGKIKERKDKQSITKTKKQIVFSDIRSWLGQEIVQPTFLPQLQDLRTLYVACSSKKLSRQTGSDFRQLAEKARDDIVLLLVPGISSGDYTHIRNKLDLIRGVVIVDTLNLLRILNIEEGQVITGVMEIILEQLPLSLMCPYISKQGKYRPETFVGRVDDVYGVLSDRYSRIFSGRRLGKTVLMKHVRQQALQQMEEQASRGDSRNLLHVMYESIVGREDEADVIQIILEGFQKVEGIQIDPIDYTVPLTTDDFSKHIVQIVNDNPKLNFLILLDESDSFFENQLELDAEYTGSGPANTLSWRMRDLEKYQDANEKSRIRFIFCGFRVTHRSEGAWGNWNPVLSLSPLRPIEATRLVLGPLSRIGIDVHEQAAVIAYRCGYHPAIIIKFCTVLIDHIEALHQRVVTQKDVSAVFNSSNIRGIIQEITWMNFDKNPMGRLIFGAILHILYQLPAGCDMDNAVQRIENMLGEILVNEDFKQVINEIDWTTQVDLQLRDMVKRSILIQSGQHPISYRLKFPHHLLALYQDEITVKLNVAFKELRSQDIEPQKWILTEESIQLLRLLLSDEAQQESNRYRLIFIASNWLDAFHDGLDVHLRLSNKPLYIKSPKDIIIPDENASVKIMYGGVACLRSLLSQDMEQRNGVYIHTTGRVSQANVKAWFDRKRGVTASAEAWSFVMNKTAGIPFLVGKLDAYVLSENLTGSELGDAQFKSILDELFDMSQWAEELCGTDESICLTVREQEILWITSKVAESLEHESIEEDSMDDDQSGLLAMILQDSTFLKEKLGEISIKLKPLGRSDLPKLELLMRLGLIPEKQAWGAELIERIAPIKIHDPLLSLMPFVFESIKRSQ